MIHTGDALTILRKLPGASVHCCITSPPYFGLRDYGTAKWRGGDPACDHKPQFQSRDTRPLGKMHGGSATIDAGTAIRGGDCRRCGARRIDKQLGLERTPELYVARLVEVFREVKRVLRDDGSLWLNLGDSYAATTKGSGGHTKKQDSNVGSFHSNRQWAIAPGLKPKDLIGIPWRVAFALQADGWWLRSDVIWAKPNPMPESITDRPTKSHEYFFLLSKNARYYYDGDAVKETATNKACGNKDAGKYKGVALCDTKQRKHLIPAKEFRNRRTVWTICTRPYKAAHFATFPAALVEPALLAGCPVNGNVLDPFAGAGTVGLVAAQHGRGFIGIELNPAYVKLANERLRAAALRMAA